MTDDQWDAFAAATAEFRSQMPRCMCACKCQYPLHSSRSVETHTCFSCRVKLHTGSGRATMEAAQ